MVTPFSEQSEAGNPNKYRPIIVTNSFSIIFKNAQFFFAYQQFLADYKLLSGSQFVFGSGFSTMNSSSQCKENFSGEIKKNKGVTAVLLVM